MRTPGMARRVALVLALAFSVSLVRPFTDSIVPAAEKTDHTVIGWSTTGWSIPYSTGWSTPYSTGWSIPYSTGWTGPEDSGTGANLN
jgi:hypothetical protein